MGLLRAGEGSRKVRSVMEPELECRRNAGACWLPLPCDDTEPLRAMRFVMVWPTGVGDRGWVRRAAAAADDERDALLSWFRMNAFVAASEADELTGGWGAWWEDGMLACAV
jgi:hypothetical protein